MVLLFIRLEEVRNYEIYLYLKNPCFTTLHQTLVYMCVGTYLMTHNRVYNVVTLVGCVLLCVIAC